jgi:uncharacterized protein DUF4157
MQQLATKNKSDKAAARKPNAAPSGSLQTLPVFVFGADAPAKAGCACGGGCPRCRNSTRVQAKLAVSRPGDPYEQEADRVAEQVMRMAAPARERTPDSDSAGGAACPACVKTPAVQRKAHKDRRANEAVPDNFLAELGSGEALDAESRAFFEPRFGRDFDRVRVHTDARAAESARSVSALAYTVGSHVVFGSAYNSRSTDGRRLIAHELAHTVQQDGVGHSHAAPMILQRMAFVRPADAADDIKGQFNTICPGKFTTIKASGAAQISADCSAADRSASKGCDCLCDVVHDTKRQYWIDVQSPTISNKPQELHDKTTVDVPDASVLPKTDGDTITMYPTSGSAVEIGAFQADGKAIWLENWRILAHELCGHARLNQSYSGDRGCREEHNATIDTENEIVAEHGGAARGHFADPKQGESFFNGTGDRTKVVFSLCDGLYFEPPDTPHAAKKP